MSLSKIISMFQDNSNIVYVDTFQSPLGKLVAAADDDYLFIVTFEDAKNFEKHFVTVAKELSCKFVLKKNKVLQTLVEEMSAYLEGKLKKFSVPIKTIGSEFQKEVWDKLLELPYGSTQSYGDLAKALGRPSSHSRAVGAACGANGLVIVIPCHRLVSSGSKGGYNSGVNRKDRLIELEKKCSV